MTEQKIISNKTHSIRSVCVYILTVLAAIYTAYLAQTLILLLLVAGLMSLLLSPGVKALQRLFIPRVLGATLLLTCLLVPSISLLMQLQDPISKWAQLLPELSMQLTDQIKEINDAIETSTEQPDSQSSDEGLSLFGDEQEELLSVDQPDVIETQIKRSLFSFITEMMSTAPFILVQLLTIIILILFTLVYSPSLFQQYVKLFVSVDRQKRAYHFALTAQRQLSRYILTISVINIALGLAAISFFSILGLEDAVLLGLIVGLVNFIPFVGPLFGLGLIFIAGLVQWGMDINVYYAVGGILLFNIVESQLVTPLMLAKNMRINPFIIVLWLLITGWLWGLVGILIAVPLLVCIKLMLSQYEKLERWVKFLAT